MKGFVEEQPDTVADFHVAKLEHSPQRQVYLLDESFAPIEANISKL